jgi:hypothetical protein
LALASKNRGRVRSFIALLLLVVMATSFSFAMGEDQRNYILIYLMYAMPILFLAYYPYFTKDEMPIYLFFLTILGCGLLNYSSFRISTIMYTSLFLLSFMFYRRGLTSGEISAKRYFNVIRWLIYAYFIVLVIQQFCVITGLPVLNKILGGGEVAAGIYKLNALAAEPSHLARVITILMFSYVKMRECFIGCKYRLWKDGKQDIWIWLMFLYVLLFSGSSTAFVVLPVFILYFLSWRNAFIFVAVFLVGLSSLAWLSDFEPIQRVVRLTEAVLQWDLETMYAADHSGAMRIAPLVIYIQSYLDISSISFLIGEGIDYSEIFSYIIPGVHEGAMIGGIFPTMIMNSGAVAFAMFIWMFKKYAVLKIFSYQTLLWLVLFSMTGINNYMIWLFFILFMTHNYFNKQYLSEKAK